MFAGKPGRGSCRLYLKVVDRQTKVTIWNATVRVNNVDAKKRRSVHGVFALLVSQNVTCRIEVTAMGYHPAAERVSVAGVGTVRHVVELEPFPSPEAWVA